MFNYAAIDKIPTVNQVKAIIEYMEKDPDNKYNFTFMMKMERIKKDVILLDLNCAAFGTNYEILFNECIIESFKVVGRWRS